MRFARPVIALAAAALSGVFTLARAEAPTDYPSRQVTLVVPFPAGSVTDSVARVLSNALGPALNQPVVVENRPGAQATIGAAHVAQAKPDGYTLLVGSSVMFVAKSLFKTLSYEPVDSFAPVAGFGSTAMMMVVPTDSPLRSPTDLADAVKAGNTPVSVAYGSPSGQVALALFANVSGTSPVAVSYRGIPQAMTDLMGKHVQVALVDVGTGLSHLNSNKARALAISSANRYGGAPDIPTLQEFYPQASGALETIIAILAPAGTPPAVVQKLDAAILQAMRADSVQAQFQSLNTSVLPLNADELAARIREDNPRWTSLMQKAGIEPQ